MSKRWITEVELAEEYPNVHKIMFDRQPKPQFSDYKTGRDFAQAMQEWIKQRKI